MKISRKLNQQGLVKIKKEIASRGWKIYSDRVALEASKILEPEKEWQEGGPYAYGCSQKTWENFLARKPIKDRTFEAFCHVLGIDPDEVAEVEVVQSDLKKDLVQAPDIPIFYGRKQELAILEQWIIQDKYRLINIFGFAGVGKTKLSLELTRQISGEFKYIIWRNLYYTPPLKNLLEELIQSVSDGQETELATTTEGLITQLLRYFKERLCLVIFDNLESIGQSGDLAGSDRKEYKDFFHYIGSSEHLSCVLLIGRVKFSDLERMEGIYSVRSLELDGLETEAGRKIFQDVAQKLNGNFQGIEEDWSRLINSYQGNPLALQIVARHILKIYGGNLAQFLEHDLRILKDIEQLFHWHFKGLTPDEQTIMYWLAINREGVSMDELKEYLIFAREKKLLPQTLDDLERKIPIERSGDRLTLHSLLMEYITERVIEKVCEELKSGKLQLFNSHPLIQASAKDYIRDSQIRLILQPIIDRLRESFGLELQNSLENRLPQLLASLNPHPGYTAGNLINLMHYAGIPIEGYDFSGMTIWEADLDINLPNVNFTNCRFDRCSFTQNFNWVSAIAFHPQKDLIAVADYFGGIQLVGYDGQTDLDLGGKDYVNITDLAFSPDGKLLASSSNSTVKLWNIDTGELYQTFTNKQQQLLSVAFSPDGQTVASGGDDCTSNCLRNSTINLWNVHTNKCRTLHQKNGFAINWLVFHPHENLLACIDESAFSLWDTAKEKLLYTLDNSDSKYQMGGVGFDPTGETLVSSYSDGTIKICNARTGETLKTWEGHTEQVLLVSFSGDGQRIISVSKDDTIKIWNAQTQECLKTAKIDVKGIHIIEFLPQKNILATYDKNRMLLKLWNVDTEKCLKAWQGRSKNIATIAISPNARIVASCSADRTIILWDSNGKLISTWRLNRRAVGVRFSPNGQTLVGWTEDGIIELWDVETGKHQKTLKHSLRKMPLNVKYNPDGKLLASYDITGNLIIVWDVKTGEKLTSINAGSHHENIALNRDGQYLAVSRYDWSKENTIIEIWNVSTGKSYRNLVCPPNEKIYMMVFHPHDQLLVSWNGKLIIVWDFKTDKSKLIQTFEDYIGTVHNLFFDREGNTLIASSIDSTIEIWQVDNAEIWSTDSTARRIRVLKGHESSIKTVSVTPDGQTLVSCDKDGVILRWDLKTKQTLKLLRQKPYEGMNIFGVQGLTYAQKDILIALGAVIEPK